MTGELALDEDGDFLAVRLTGYGNLGAYLGRGAGGPPGVNAIKNIDRRLSTPLIEVSTKVVFTNTSPVGAYRGAGRPEGNYYMERLIERPRPRWASTGSRCAGATTSPKGDAVQGRIRHDL